jgi:DNA repair protein RadC
MKKTPPGEKSSGAERYQERLFACFPVFSTRLVREATVTFPERYRVRSPHDAALILQDYFADKDREELVAVLLDTAHTITGLVRVSVGGLQSSIVEPAQVFEAAILANAAAVILAHNHPSGNPEPSKEDVTVTKKVIAAGEVIGIPVLDHLIMTEGGFTSLAERGLTA